MFGIDSSEFLLIGAVALVAIGPKDLPRLMRAAGQWIAKARRMSSHFRAGVNEMVKQVEAAANEAVPDLKIPTSPSQIAMILITPNTRSKEPGGRLSNVVPLQPSALARSLAPPPPSPSLAEDIEASLTSSNSPGIISNGDTNNAPALEHHGSTHDVAGGPRAAPRQDQPLTEMASQAA